MSKIKDLLARAISLASEQPMSWKPKITGGGGRTGEARKDEVSLLPLGLHYPYRYSIVTTRTFPIGIRFTSRTKISYYTIIV